MNDYLSVLEKCPLFEGLSGDELRELLERSRGRLRFFRKGEMLASAGEVVHFLHIMVEGSVKGEMTDAGGKVIKIEEIRPPRPLATGFLFGKENRFPVNIIAETDSKVFSIPSDAFLELMQSSDVVLKQFVGAVSSRAQFLSRKIKYLSFTTIKGKLVQYMFELAASQGSDHIRLPLSQASLAEFFGVARPSVGRAVVELKDAGLIHSQGREISILNRKELSKLLK